MRYIFSNCPQDFLKNVDKLPDDMIYEIYAYLPKIVTMFLTKENYLKDHHLLKTLTNKRHIENYIRTMVRQDNEFVFNQLLVENYHRWIQMTKYYYKNCIYSNYLTFIESYAIDNESTKCRRLLCEFLLELGLSKNQHKKNIVKYIRWRT